MSSLSLQQLLNETVSAKVAPGILAVAFSKTGSQFATAAAGVRDPALDAPMEVNTTTVWMASMSKAVCSVAGLVLAERHNISLDSNEALSTVLPELKLGNGGPADKIFDGKDDEGKYKLRPATVGVTLRHLLSHTSGFGYDFTSAEVQSLHPPHGDLPPMSSGATSAFNIPRLFESGTKWMYGCSTDWIGQFIIRLSGLTLREAYSTLVFEPLGVDPTLLDVFRTPELEQQRGAMGFKAGEGHFVPIPFDTPQYEGQPPEGFASLATASLWGTFPAFAKFLESFFYGLAKDETSKPLISPELWREASGDALAAMQLSLPSPMVETVDSSATNSLDMYSAPKEAHSKGEGWTLLQTVYDRAESATGKSAGTMGWAGLANTYYFVDPVRNVGGVVGGQFLPFADEGMLKLRDDFEAWVYENAA